MALASVTAPDGEPRLLTTRALHCGPLVCLPPLCPLARPHHASTCLHCQPGCVNCNRLLVPAGDGEAQLGQAPAAACAPASQPQRRPGWWPACVPACSQCDNSSLPPQALLCGPLYDGAWLGAAAAGRRPSRQWRAGCWAARQAAARLCNVRGGRAGRLCTAEDTEGGGNPRCRRVRRPAAAARCCARCFHSLQTSPARCQSIARTAGSAATVVAN